MDWLLAERTKRTLFALWCLGWAMVAVKSLQPDLQLPMSLSDKTVHFAAYAFMAAAVAGFCHAPGRIIGWAAATVALGGLLELGQEFVPSRTADLADLAADAAGAACGALLALLWLFLVVRPLRPSLAR